MTRETTPHTADRFANLEPDHACDVLIIGGGIVGSGAARDAAMRGVSTVLVEQNDFASGTSSRSSRLLHGGLRYLAQGHVGLVREASLEKRVVHTIAPHLATPLPFVFPTYRKTPWKRWKLSIGVKLYDLICGGRNFGKSQSLNRQKVIGMLPGLNRHNLTGAVRYFDGFTNDARLAIDTLRAANQHGAHLYNYAAFEDASFDNGVWSCQIRNRLTNQPTTVRARAVVNAAGPWADRPPHSKIKLRLTKGVHLVIDRERFPIEDAVVMAEGDRILFAIPWGQRVIIGTTDTDYTGPIDAPQCDADDIQYIMGIANAAFPEAHLGHDDVISTWAGLRPLIASGREKTGAPSDISRSHSINMTQPGWFDVAGGKLTTYRLMAEQAIDKVRHHLGLEKTSSQTATTPLLAPSETADSGLLPPDVSQELVEHYCHCEWAIHLDDVMIRRTSWAYYHHDADATANTVAHWMAQALGWDNQTLDEELQRYANAINRPTTTTKINGHTNPNDTTAAPQTDSPIPTNRQTA